MISIILLSKNISLCCQKKSIVYIYFIKCHAVEISTVPSIRGLRNELCDINVRGKRKKRKL